MMANSLRYVGMIGLIVVLGACDDDGDDPREREASPSTGSSGSAGAGARAASARGAVDVDGAQLALGELASTVDATVTGFSAQPATPGAAAGAIDVACSGGGGARVQGRVNVVPSPVMVDVDVNIDYAACLTRSGSLVEGSLRFTQRVDAVPGTPLRVATRYQGDLSFSGRLQLRCPIDVVVVVDEAGRAVSVSGDVCGQDAAGLSVQVTPHWQAQQ